MKAIVIENCEDCPLCHYIREKAYCNSAARCDRKLKDRYLGAILSQPKIPEWCPLSNYTSHIIDYFLKHKIIIPLVLRELALIEEGRRTP